MTKSEHRCLRASAVGIATLLIVAVAPPPAGAQNTLTVSGLRPKTTYYYAVAARDNVSGRLGPRSPTVKVRTK